VEIHSLLAKTSREINMEILLLIHCCLGDSVLLCVLPGKP